MTPGQVLEIAAHIVTAALALWLGLTVLVRTTAPTGRLFGILAVAIAAWSTGILVVLLSEVPSADAIGHAVGEIGAAFAIAAVAHLSLLIAAEGHPSPRRLLLIAAGYVVLVGLALPSAVDSSMNPTGMALGPLPGALFGWAWIAARLAALVLAVAWLLEATRAAERRSQRRRQLRVALATVLIGAVGASLRFLPVIGNLDSWIGLSFVAVALVLAAYAVFAAAIFFDSTVATRAFWTSLLGGLLLAVLVAFTLAIDTAGRELAGLDVPLFTGLALVVAVAVYEPVTARLKVASAGNPAEVARQRLLTALGGSALVVQPAAAGIEPALEHLAGTLGVAGVEVIGPGGERLAGAGDPGPTATLHPLVADGEELGQLRIGAVGPATDLPRADAVLVDRTAAYVATALRTGRREEQQAASLAGLTADRADVEQQAFDLHEAMVRHATREPGLSVYALGSLRVERQGVPIERWGGDKAGSRQAEGLFAFLLDRGERGVGKDEVLELIWPDVDLEKADLAFHRTMVGLRQTLDPARRRGTEAAIRFHNDRYRLSPEVVEWSDIGAFLANVEAAAGAEPGRRRRLLEAARVLVRGPYLDDCPFYGDSSQVEERRTHLHALGQDLLIALGEAYAADGDRVAAAAAFREALARATEPCAPAEAGLARLGF